MTLGAGTGGYTLAFGHTLLVPPQDIQMTFQITPGVGSVLLETGPGTSITELLCADPTGPGGSCASGALNVSVLFATNGGVSFSLVDPAATDYVFKDIAGGSGFAQTFVPEPMTLSLMGAGLLAIGYFGRKRIRK
jgi:hypothetical protein